MDSKIRTLLGGGALAMIIVAGVPAGGAFAAPTNDPPETKVIHWEQEVIELETVNYHEDCPPGWGMSSSWGKDIHVDSSSPYLRLDIDDRAKGFILAPEGGYATGYEAPVKNYDYLTANHISIDIDCHPVVHSTD